MAKMAPDLHGVAPVSSASARDALYPVPELHRRVYRTDTKVQERWDGAAWVVDPVDYANIANAPGVDAAFANNSITTSGLNYGYNAGVAAGGGGFARIAAGTVALIDNAVNYVERSYAGVVSRNTTAFTATNIPMAKVTTVAGVITLIEDWRTPPAPVQPFIDNAAFGQDVGTTSGLNYGYTAGTAVVAGVFTKIAAGTVLLTNNATNYIERTYAGVVSKNTTGFTADRIPLAKATTAGGQISAVVDYRSQVSPPVPYPLLAGEVGVANTQYPVGHAYRYGGVGNGVVNDTTALSNAFASAVAVGGTVTVPPGLFLHTGLSLANARNVTVRGDAGGWGGDTAAAITRLVYTGTGGGTGISLASSYGVRFENIRIGYNNAGFTGNLIGTGWSGASLDPQAVTFRECSFEGVGVAGAAALIDTSRLITASFTRCFFTKALRAFSCPTALYTNQVVIKECQFFHLTNAPIFNPGDSWTVQDNTFEGLASNKAGAIEMDAAGGRLARALEYRGNWHGDAGVDGGNWMTNMAMLGGSIENNFFSEPGVTSHCVGLYAGSAPTVKGNRFEATNGVKFMISATTVPWIVGNDFGSCTNPILNPGFANSGVVFGNVGLAGTAVAGSWGGFFAGKNLATQLATIGLITDSTTLSGTTAVPYSATVVINAATTDIAEITVTNNTAFSISVINVRTGQRLRVRIRNASGGVMGVITWNGIFKLAAWTNPANGFSRTIDYDLDTTNTFFVEAGRTTVDVPN